MKYTDLSISFSFSYELSRGPGPAARSSHHTKYLHQSPVSQSVSQSALTPPPSLRPAPPLLVKHNYIHKYRVLAPGGRYSILYSIIASLAGK